MELERGQAGARVPLLHRPGDGRAAGQLRAPLRPARAGPPRRRAGDADAARGRGAAGAAALLRAPARGRDRARPRRLLPPAAQGLESAARRAGRGRGAADGRGAGMERARLRAAPTSRCRGGSAPAPCSPRSTRWSGRASAPSGSSTSATGSRSTCRRRSASTATTSSPSCSATGWSPASTSKATARRGCCGWSAPSPSRGSTTGVVARELADELRLVAEWLGLGGVEVARKGDLAATLRKAGRLMPQSDYTFGDSDLAARRLELVGTTFEDTTRDFLARGGPDRAGAGGRPRQRAGPHDRAAARDAPPGADDGGRLLPRLRRADRASGRAATTTSRRSRPTC